MLPYSYITAVGAHGWSQLFKMDAATRSASRHNHQPQDSESSLLTMWNKAANTNKVDTVVFYAKATAEIMLSQNCFVIRGSTLHSCAVIEAECADPDYIMQLTWWELFYVYNLEDNQNFQKEEDGCGRFKSPCLKTRNMITCPFLFRH